jgi:hypothetical protein
MRTLVLELLQHKVLELLQYLYFLNDTLVKDLDLLHHFGDFF